MRKPWTTSERKFLTDNYQKMSNVEMAAILGRSLSSVNWCLSYMGVDRATAGVPNKFARWTQAEDEYLSEHFEQDRFNTAVKLGRTLAACYEHYKKLNTDKKAHRRWTDKDDAYLIQHAGIRKFSDIAKAVGRTVPACWNRLYLLRKKYGISEEHSMYDKFHLLRQRLAGND